MTANGYRNTALPEDLCERVDKVIKDSNSGYKSLSEFAKDAVRRRLEDIESRAGAGA